jgi:hypothetical protein
MSGKEQASIFENPHLIVFVPESTIDQELVRTFLAKHGPKVLEEDRVVSSAELTSFHPQQVIVCMWRDTTRGVTEPTRDDQGKLIEVRRPLAELLSELRVGLAVEAGKHWRKAGGMRAGSLDADALIDAVNATCSPWRLYWRDAGSPVPRVLGLMR